MAGVVGSEMIESDPERPVIDGTASGCCSAKVEVHGSAWGLLVSASCSRSLFDIANGKNARMAKLRAMSDLWVSRSGSYFRKRMDSEPSLRLHWRIFLLETLHTANPAAPRARPTIIISSASLFSCELEIKRRMASSSKLEALGVSSAWVCHSPRYNNPRLLRSSMARCAAAGWER